MLFLFGIIILLTGLTFLIVSASLQNVRKVTVKSELNSWEVSENLTKGNTYIVDITSTYYWRDNYTAGEYTEPQPIDVLIVSPNRNITKLQAFFYARPSTSPYYTSTFPSLVFVEYGQVDSDSLEVDESYLKIRFTVKQSGNYSTRILHVNETVGPNEWAELAEPNKWAEGPPAEMIIYREVIEGASPFIAPSGGILCLVGVVVSVFGAKATKKLAVKKKSSSHRQVFVDSLQQQLLLIGFWINLLFR